MKQQPPGMGRPFEEMKRVSRILETVQMITVSPCRYRRRDLAARFEVTERTIQKDLDVIRHGMRLPLSHSPQGYFLEETPKLPAVRYSFAEAVAMLLALRAAVQTPGVASPELAAAAARLEAIFPPQVAAFLRRAMEQPVMTVNGAHRREMLMLLQRALIEGRKVRIMYKTSSRGGDLNERVVRPYHLMPYVRSWQLIGHCEKRDTVLMFKVDRILQATIMEEKYSIPADFDAAEYLGPAWGVMRSSGSDPVDVVLRFEARAGGWVAEEHWHPSQKVEELPDGRIVFKLHVVPTPEFVNWILYYGSRVEVLAPQELRERVADEHRSAAAIYAQRSASDSNQQEDQHGR